MSSFVLTDLLERGCTSCDVVRPITVKDFNLCWLASRVVLPQLRFFRHFLKTLHSSAGLRMVNLVLMCLIAHSHMKLANADVNGCCVATRVFQKLGIPQPC